MWPRLPRLVQTDSAHCWGKFLETKYRLESTSSNGRRLQSWAAVLIAFNVLSTLVDYDSLDQEAFFIQTVLTLGFFVPVALGAIVVLNGHPSRRKQDLTVATVTILDMLVVLNGARLAPAQYAETYLVLAAIIPFLAGMIVPMSFRHLLLYSGTCFAIFASFVALLYANGAEKLGIPLFLACIVLVPIKVGYERERQERLRFLLRAAEKTRAEELTRANARLTLLSQTDSLTGLANRRHFTERLTADWDEAREQGGWLSIIVVDIDHFKRINDSAGHAAGDLVIRQVADVLEAVIGAKSGLSARFGGEEFIALLKGTTPRVASEVGERVRRAVTDLGMVHPGLSQAGTVSVSVGVTTAHGRVHAYGLGIGGLLKAADEALYAAKRSGRNRVLTVEPGFSSHAMIDDAPVSLAQ